MIKTCPLEPAFGKWWIGRARRNMREAQAAGGAMRAGNYAVTEEQANDHLKLLPKNFKPGEVLRKLTDECGLSVSERGEGTNLIAWKPTQKPLEMVDSPLTDTVDFRQVKTIPFAKEASWPERSK